jgi:hypothetical protein
MADVSSPELSQALKLLRKLDPKQRRLLASRIADLDGFQIDALYQPGADWLLHGLEHELHQRGLYLHALTPVRIKTMAPDYIKDARVLRHRLIERWGGTPTGNELRALGRYCAGALATYLNDVKYLYTEHELSPRLLLRNITDIPMALDHCFPGYLGGGTLRMLVRSEQQRAVRG